MMKRGFTLIEMIVALAIAIVIMGVVNYNRTQIYNQYVPAMQMPEVVKEAGNIVAEVMISGQKVQSGDYTPSQFKDRYGIALPKNPIDKANRWYIDVSNYEIIPEPTSYNKAHGYYCNFEVNGYSFLKYEKISYSTDNGGYMDFGHNYQSYDYPFDSYPIAGTSLVHNGGFEKELLHWYSSEKVNGSWTTTPKPGTQSITGQHYTGKFGFQFQSDSSVSSSYLFQDVNVSGKAGDTLVLNGMCYTNDPSATEIVFIYYYKADGSTRAKVIRQRADSNCMGQWGHVSIKETIPVDYTKLRVGIHFATTSVGYYAIWDNISLFYFSGGGV